MNKALRLTIAFGAGLAITLATTLLFASLPALSEGETTPQGALLANGGFEGVYEQEGDER